MRNWRGDKGLLDVFSFRSDSWDYLNTKKLTEEVFVLDILQALCDEAVAVTTRLHLLGVLQEYASVLLTTPASIEQTVASLQDVFRQSKPRGTTVYKCQLLVTVTTILITSDCVDSHVDLLREFVEVLLDSASQVTTSSLSQLHAATCQGILSRKLEYIYQWCHLETTAVHQSYLSLFVTVLKNVICQLSSNPDSATDQSLTQILCNRREPLKPFIYPNMLLDLASSKSVAPLPPHVNITALEQVLEYVLKFVDLAAPSAGAYMMRQLVSVVNQVSRLSPGVFHLFMSRHLTSLDILMLHMTTELQSPGL
ncbi:hypothetical protein LSAT2_014534 [Lamellibrachia satsuma]|nr:hypothetical protein LSAT2_014534 [Lamellibrachia satsuma]